MQRKEGAGSQNFAGPAFPFATEPVELAMLSFGVPDKH